MKTIKIDATTRKKEDMGKKVSNHLRKNNIVPCVLYGGEENVHFMTSQYALKKLVYTPEFYSVELSIDGTTKKAIMKDLQFHPVTDKLMHVDFLEVTSGKPFVTRLPVRLTGTAAGVKEGGKLLLNKRTLKVKVLPENLVDSITFDVTELELGKSIKVSAVELPGIEILENPGIPVASVEIPRALKSADAEAEGEEGAEGTEGAEGEEAATEK